MRTDLTVNRSAASPRLSHRHRPEGMTLEAWQTELRRQFGRGQKFSLRNLGNEPVFSEFEVENPESRGVYRVAIRGTQAGENYCSCPDFATNALGTCKHVEFVLSTLEQRRGGRAALRSGFRPSYSEVYLQYGAQRIVRFRPGRDAPAELIRLASRTFEAEGALRPGAFARFDAFLSAAGRIKHDLRCYDDALAFVAELRDAEHRRERLQRAFPRGARSPALRNLLRVPLYPYQADGALFAARAGRSLNADEMGLGKTIQAIAAVEIMARHFGVERVLVICPTSLKHQWQREIDRFCGRSAQIIGGLRPARERLYGQDGFFYKITNYDTVHRDLELIQKWSPDLLVLDEAQRIKNWRTRAARNIKRISSPYAIVLTGTPLENRLEELVSIVEFADRHRLGPTFRFLDEHQTLDDHGRVVGYRHLDRIGKTLEPVLIRRTKKEVLDQLPERIDKNLFVPMTPEQSLHHEENREIVARVVAKWRRYGFLSEADQRRLTIGLQNMRMSCDSTYLLDQKTDFGVKADELATLLEEAYERPDVKVVVFSQWVRMHELLVRRFRTRRWEHVLFHGQVPGPQRGKLIDRFREDPACRAFLSTDAGGVGLNLQHASLVVNMDLPWNPAVLEQRIGRVHRLGQRQAVRVVNFVAKGTIEEGMLELLKFKKSLFAGVLDDGEKEVFLGGTRLTRFMKSVERVAGSIPEAAVEVPTEPAAAPERGDAVEPEEEPSKPARPTGADPWAGLLQAGLSLLQQAAAPRSGSTTAGKAVPGLSLVRRDERTGEAYLRLPVPSPELADQLLRALGGLLERLRT